MLSACHPAGLGGPTSQVAPDIVAIFRGQITKLTALGHSKKYRLRIQGSIAPVQIGGAVNQTFYSWFENSRGLLGKWRYMKYQSRYKNMICVFASWRGHDKLCAIMWWRRKK